MSETGLAQHELTGEYDVDPAHSRIGFVARHAMVSKVRGHFRDYQGRAYLDFTDPTKSSAELIVEELTKLLWYVPQGAYW